MSPSPSHTLISHGVPEQFLEQRACVCSSISNLYLPLPMRYKRSLCFSSEIQPWGAQVLFPGKPFMSRSLAPAFPVVNLGSVVFEAFESSGRRRQISRKKATRLEPWKDGVKKKVRIAVLVTLKRSVVQFFRSGRRTGTPGCFGVPLQASPLPKKRCLNPKGFYADYG